MKPSSGRGVAGVRTRRPAAARARRPGGGPLLFAAVLLLAANLRPAVASVGPVLADLRADLGLSGAAAAALSALPVVCFGLASALAPVAARRLGPDGALVAVLGLTASGLLLRLLPSTGALFGGTLLAGAAIAVGNVLLPALVKREFPHRVGLVTGVYTSVVSLAAATAAAATVPLAQALGGGWRTGLGLWAVPALVALAVWVPLAVVRRDPALAARPVLGASMLRSPLAWAVTTFMGLQSLGFYAMLAWLPTVLREEGLSAVAAGGLLGLLATVGTPGGLVLPSLLVRAPDQRRWVVVVTSVTGLGLLGLALAPGAVPLLWAVLIGLGQGAAFPLALTLVVLRTRDADDAARLSAMSQGFGYTLAALGPLALGALRDATGDWRVPLLLLVVLLVPQLVAGLVAGGSGTVDGGPSGSRRPAQPDTGPGTAPGTAPGTEPQPAAASGPPTSPSTPRSRRTAPE